MINISINRYRQRTGHTTVRIRITMERRSSRSATILAVVSRTFQSPTDSCRNPGIPAEFRWNPAGIQEFCRNDQIPWIPGGFREDSGRNPAGIRIIFLI